MFDDEFDVHSSSEECVIKQTEKQKDTKKTGKNEQVLLEVFGVFSHLFAAKAK